MRKKITPPRFIVLSFLALIIAGGILLIFPFASSSHQFTNPLITFFTSTSATCVTGLVVVDTGTYWSGWGQFIIILLIQCGGLGYMTITSFFLILLNKKVSLEHRMILKQGLNVYNISGIMRFLQVTLLVVLIMEGLGTIALTLRFLRDFSFWRALTMGAFHSVSAFCNAGFDIMGGFQSFQGYTNDLTLNLTVMILIVTGGIGFYVLWRLLHPHDRGLTFHVKIVLRITLFLILAGAGLFLLFEWRNPNSIANFSLRGKLLAAFFQSITPRTAGFSTVAIKNLNQSTQFILTWFMLIGGSPGGTAGGIKTTTFIVITGLVVYSIRRKGNVVIGKRTIKKGTLMRAVFVFGFAIFVIAIATLVILFVQGGEFTFLQVLFEVISAFGTVGLSTGITTHLSSISRFVIIVTMFVGRIGSMSLVISMMGRRKTPHIGYPEEDIAIG
ncbi:MAG: potassium transporter TrkG [Caldisericota bacterium]|nr:potassium transporter TrkG [Caldisericota bacterium]